MIYKFDKDAVLISEHQDEEESLVYTDVLNHNSNTPDDKQGFVKSSTYPPSLSDYLFFDSATITYQKASNRKDLDDSKLILTNTQKVDEFDKIVNKTEQELVDDGLFDLAPEITTALTILEREIESFLETAKTANGYSVNNFARQKGILSFPYINVDDADPNKAPLIASGLIYPSAKTGEMFTFLGGVNAAFMAATAAINASTDLNYIRTFNFVDFYNNYTL